MLRKSAVITLPEESFICAGVLTELQSSWLFLDFMMALERQIQAACSGSCALPLPSPPALCFFTVAKNRKVCNT